MKPLLTVLLALYLTGCTAIYSNTRPGWQVDEVLINAALYGSMAKATKSIVEDLE